MIDILIVSHGNLAHEFFNTVQMIVGSNIRVETIGFSSNEHIDVLGGQILAKLNNFENEVLVFTDLLGGSPMQMVVSTLKSYRGNDVGIITGMNLPMLLEVVIQSNTITLKDAVAVAIETGHEGIKYIERILVKEMETL